jgi:hypothetical protein
MPAQAADRGFGALHLEQASEQTVEEGQSHNESLTEGVPAGQTCRRVSGAFRVFLRDKRIELH